MGVGIAGKRLPLRMTSVIQVNHLTKWYGPTRAVDDLSFDIPAGQIVGFLGPNGAGKSTTLRMLTGYIPPTAGSASIDGYDVTTQSAKARACIGYLPESTPLYTEMRVSEYLHYRGRLMKMRRTERVQRIEEVTERCGLAHNRRRVIGHLSKGNRQRVGIAQALLHQPQVMILDEPTAGLDPNQTTEVRKLIGELKHDHTVILSSHILPEVEKIVDRVLIIASGRIVAEGTPQELRRSTDRGADVVIEVKAAAEALGKAINGMELVESVQTETLGEWARATITPRQDAEVREALGQVCLTNGWAVRELRDESGSLEQFFIQITAAQAGADAAA